MSQKPQTRVKHQRIIHTIGVGVCLTLFGASWWWVAGRMARAAAHARQAPIAVPEAPPVSTSDPAGLPSAVEPTIVGDRSGESAEQKALRADVVARQQALARAQDAALAGIPETEQVDALRAFVASHREEIRAASEAQDRLLKTGVTSTDSIPSPAMKAAQTRFAGVRKAILEDGLTLDEAEARFKASTPDP
jgi:hypothetical protein